MSPVLELAAQIQMKLSDGSVVVLSPPTIKPAKATSIEDVLEALMSLKAPDDKAAILKSHYCDDGCTM